MPIVKAPKPLPSSLDYVPPQGNPYKVNSRNGRWNAYNAERKAPAQANCQQTFHMLWS
jgi:hypothetical protein